MEEVKELIKNEKYHDALKILLLKEGYHLEKIQCLYELEKHDELLDFYNSIKKDIASDYYEILGFVINSLIIKENFDEALKILNEELSLPYIPDNYEYIINELYDDVIAMKRIYLSENNAYHSFNEEQVKEILENDNDYYNLSELVSDLHKYNVRSIIESVEIFLKRDVSSILKTMVLEECLRQELSQTLLIIKDNIEYEFLCSANQYVQDDENYKKTVDVLVERLEKTPSFLEMALSILFMYSYIIYPLTIEDDESLFLALVIEYYVYTLNLEELEVDYNKFGYSNEIIEAGFDWLANILKTESVYENEFN